MTERVTEAEAREINRLFEVGFEVLKLLHPPGKPGFHEAGLHAIFTAAREVLGEERVEALGQDEIKRALCDVMVEEEGAARTA